MIFSSPPQFGQCSRSRSNTRLSSRAQLSRTGLWCAQIASHSAGGAAWAGGSSSCGTTSARSLALGARKPWKRIRCSRGRGTNAASRCMNSSGDISCALLASLRSTGRCWWSATVAACCGCRWAKCWCCRPRRRRVTLRTTLHSHVLDETLSQLHERLHELGGAFIRIHRNALVARAAVRALELRPDAAGDAGEGWAVRVAPHGEWLAVSRRQLGAVRAALAGAEPRGAGGVKGAAAARTPRYPRPARLRGLSTPAAQPPVSVAQPWRRRRDTKPTASSPAASIA